MTKKQVSQELEQIIAEEIEKALVDEGILGGLGNVAKGAVAGMGQIPGLVKKGMKRVQDLYKTGSEEENDAKRARTQLEKDLVLISTFIDAAERNPAVSKVILDTDLGKKLFSPQMQTEAYGSKQLLQMMKKAKIGPQDVRTFFIDIGKDQAATKLLNQVKEMTPGFEPQQGQQAQAQAQQPQGQPQAGEMDTSGQPAVQQGAPESPKGNNVPQPVLSGEEAKKMAKERVTTDVNGDIKRMLRSKAEEIEEMTDIDEETKKEVANGLRRLANNRSFFVPLARQIGQKIDTLEENKQLERLKKLAGILKD